MIVPFHRLQVVFCLFYKYKAIIVIIYNIRHVCLPIGAEGYDLSPLGDELAFAARNTDSSAMAWTTKSNIYLIGIKRRIVDASVAEQKGS